MSENQYQSSRLARITAMFVLLAFLPLATTGCFGRFELTRKVYKWNQQVDENKWVQEVVFLVISIVPVYGVASMVDALIVNSIEFWTGENPAVAGTTHEVRGENGELARATMREDGAIDLQIIDSEKNTHELLLKRDGDQVAAMDLQGREIARVGYEDGVLALISAASH